MMKRTFFSIAVLLLFVFQLSASNAFGAWTIETVDDAVWTGEYTSIAVDSSGYAHIIYHDQYKYLWYAHNTLGDWSLTLWDWDVGSEKSIVADSSDHLHMCYGKQGVGLLYATNASGAWVTETVDSSAGDMRSLAVDFNGYAHLSYRDISFGLKYATNASGSWAIETVGSNSIVYNSIAVDSNGHAHISYQDWNDGDENLMYATNASGLWVVETVEEVGRTGFHNSIAVDSANRIHISYHDHVAFEWDEDLRYAKKELDIWGISTLDGNGCAFEATSIAVDSSSQIHISYCGSDHTLKYASNPLDLWAIQTVDADGEVGLHNSITVDSGGGVHIGYQDGSPDWNLKYAFKVEEFTRITLDSPSDLSILSTAPTFTWIPDGGTNNVFAVDLALPPVVPFWSTYNNMHILIDQTSWTMPETIWSVLPSGSRLYWRVRGADLDHAPLTVVTSDEVWSFYK